MVTTSVTLGLFTLAYEVSGAGFVPTDLLSFEREILYLDSVLKDLFARMGKKMAKSSTVQKQRQASSESSRAAEPSRKA